MDLDEVEKRHSKLVDHEAFVNNPYNLAVDNKTDTAWISLSGISLFFIRLPQFPFYLSITRNKQGRLFWIGSIGAA